SYIDDHYNDALNYPELFQEAYTLFDAYVTYITAQANWELSLFGKNITDETYIVSGFANGLTQGRVSANLGRPQEWGLSFTYRFGQ
ncbi:MAG: hypothetical protein ACREB3_18170, partial [Burkholderiales bacterium]